MPYDHFFLDNQCDTEEGELIEKKHLMTMDTKSDEDDLLKLDSNDLPINHEESKLPEKEKEFETKPIKNNAQKQKEKSSKPFEYKSKDDTDKKAKDEPK